MDGIEIFVFVAFMGLLLYQKVTGKSKEKKPRQKRPVVVPERETADEASETVVPVQEIYGTGLSDKTVSVHKPVRTVSAPKKAGSVAVPPTAGNPEESIRFRNREDARRAFLYSEIFNRKYD